MTRFEEVLQEHEKQKLKKIAEERIKAKQEAEAREEFSRSFLAAAATVKPIFTEFVTEARRHGFPAAVEDGCDQNGNPYLRVRFFPQRYVVTSVDTSHDCAFILLANLAEKQVVANTHFHLWPEISGTHKITFSRRTLNKATLNRLLYEFLSASLDGRDAS